MAYDRVLIRAANNIRPDEGSAVSAEAILPGALVTKNSSGLLINQIGHGGNLPPGPLWVARRNLFNDAGATASGTMTDTWLSGDTVKYWMLRSQDEFVCRLKEGAGQSVVFGDGLQPTADGEVIKHTASADIAVATAAETKDNTGGGAATFLHAIAGSQ